MHPGSVLQAVISHRSLLQLIFSCAKACSASPHPARLPPSLGKPREFQSDPQEPVLMQLGNGDLLACSSCQPPTPSDRPV